MQDLSISIDNGDNLGICIWQGGKPVNVFHVPKKRNGTFLEKAVRQVLFLDRLMPTWEKKLGGKFTRGVMEETFCRDKKKGGPRPTADAILKLTWKAGAVFAVMALRGMDVLVMPKKDSKQTAAALAKAYGITTKNEHAIDAFFVGVLAGYDRAVK